MFYLQAAHLYHSWDSGSRRGLINILAQNPELRLICFYPELGISIFNAVFSMTYFYKTAQPRQWLKTPA
jgi:hypothetical protein